MNLIILDELVTVTQNSKNEKSSNSNGMNIELIKYVPLPMHIPPGFNQFTLETHSRGMVDCKSCLAN